MIGLIEQSILNIVPKESVNNVTQLPLPLASEVITIHCFFRCMHIIQSADPQEAHDLMEQHYIEKHSYQIDRIVAHIKR